MPALFIIKTMLVNRYTEDKMLVIMFREGSDEAFNEIVRRYYEKLLRLVYFSMQETDAASRTVCRIFVCCYFDKSDFLAGTGALNAVYASAWRNLSAVSTFSRDPGSSRDHGTLEDSIKFAISKLSLKMRFLMYLLFYEKMDYSAIFGITGISAKKIGRKHTGIICRIKNEIDGILENIVEESGLLKQQAEN